jgi:DNA-binding response OmpR family regulator
MNEEKYSILTVDTNRRNLELLNQFLTKENYQVISANSLDDFDRLLNNESLKIKLVLLDITGFDSRIWECCERLKNRQIPFLVISPRQNALIQQASIACGAKNMLVKPLGLKQFLSLIKSLWGN